MGCCKETRPTMDTGFIETFAPSPLDMEGRHGYVTFPRSRAMWCAENKDTANCGRISHEPQSVEAQKGFPLTGGKIPPDGKLASGGIDRFSQLDAIKAPNGHDWPREPVTPGAIYKAEWYLTAEHRTSKWEYWITRDGWDPTKPLSREQLEPEPFMVFNWPHPDGFWTAHKPTKGVAHWVQMPKNKRGYHVIYAVWEVADTDNSFYQACDVEFTAAS